MSRVLVVDDSPVDLQLFERILSKMDGLTVFQAGDGCAALRQIEEWQIDLVVTDLQMPEMNGLDLVKAIREKHPHVPTILITGVGSEEIAARALIAGAAGYVPKNKAAELLRPTVQGILDVLFAEYSFERLLDSAAETRFVFDLDNDESWFRPLVELCDQMLRALSPLDQNERLRVAVAVEQALSNALYRGNLEIDPEVNVQSADGKLPVDTARLVDARRKQFAARSIRVTLETGRQDFRFTVRDEGPGFQETSRETRDHRGGRGLVLMRTFMDRVDFNRSGNEVVLLRKWKSTPRVSADAPEREQESGTAPGINLGVLVDCRDSRTIELCRPRLMVGKEPSCHIALEDPGVADHHCQLLYSFGQWYFKTVGDQEVTLNGQAARQGKLLPDDCLGIGGHEFRIQYDIG